MSGSWGRRTGVCLYKPVVRLLFRSQTVSGDVGRSLTLAEGAEETGACALAFQETHELWFVGIIFCCNCLESLSFSQLELAFSWLALRSLL